MNIFLAESVAITTSNIDSLTIKLCFCSSMRGKDTYLFFLRNNAGKDIHQQL